jgi:hypothetical protein
MNRRTKSAHHEAGHVVSFFAHGWVVTSVNIKEFNDGDTPVCGQTFTTPPTNLSIEDVLRSDIVCTLCGPLSGQKAAGETAGNIRDVDFHDDAHRVLARVTQITKDRADCKAIVQSCQNQALDFIALQWSAITAVANALLEKTELNEAEIRALCLKTLVDVSVADDVVVPEALANIPGVKVLTDEEYKTELAKRQKKEQEAAPTNTEDRVQ